MGKTLSVILIVAILGALAALGYTVATPGSGEKFTEFYILGAEGKAENYPKEVVVGGEVGVIVGIINQEHKTMSYRLEVRIEGVKNNETELPVLEQGEKWQEVVSFIPDETGDNQKVELLLYKDGKSESPLELHLWVDVKAGK